MGAPPSIEATAAARLFLTGSGWVQILRDELGAPGSASNEVALAILTPWSEVGRYARALEIIDTELRRAASAWSAATAHDDLLSSLDGPATAHDRDARFRESLVRHLRPAPDCGRLEIQDSAAHPARLMCIPTGPIADLLKHAPLAALTYALSAFGQGMLVSQGEGRPPRVGLSLDALAWAGTLATASEWPEPVRKMPGRPANYRAVTGEHEEGAPSGLAAVLLSERSHLTVDVTTVTLTPERTELFAYGAAWRELLGEGFPGQESLLADEQAG